MMLATACAAPEPPPLADLHRLYEQSIFQAAVKRPEFRHTLMPIDKNRSTVSVVHLQYYPSLDETRFTWVALPKDLKAACRGKPDPVLALQQILGLPPEPRPDWKLVRFDVSTTRIFRPCISGSDISADVCGFDPPKNVPSGPGMDVEHFVLSQAATSWRDGFSAPGYPFTGMGWSYNWDPMAPNHHGISEYVVRPGAPAVRDVTWTTPAAFCAPS